MSDLNSNIKTQVLHPLEVEIQRDFELKQQQLLAKHTAPSVLQCPSQESQIQCSDATVKAVEASNPMLERVMQIHTLPDERETILHGSKTTDNILCHISRMTPHPSVEKRQYIIVSDASILFNISTKDESKSDSKNVNNDNTSNVVLPKSEMQDISFIINNCNTRVERATKTKLESDSEDEEEDIEPVYDYEPDPDTSLKKNIEEVEKPNKCYMCFRSFRQKKNMYAHIRKIHSIQPKIEGGILCPLCKMHALRQEHLRNHLESLHEIPIEKEEKLFNTMEGG